MSYSFITQESINYYYMKFRGIISIIFFTVLITCVGTAVAGGGAESGVLFSLEPVGGAEDEYVLSCAASDNGTVGIFVMFPGPFAIVSTTLPEDRYRMDGITLACALIDEDTCSMQFRCVDLQSGTLRLSWEEFSGGLSGEKVMSVSDVGEVVSVDFVGNTGTASDGNQPSSLVQQSPFGCIVFTVVLSLAAAGVYADRRGRNLQ